MFNSPSDPTPDGTLFTNQDKDMVGYGDSLIKAQRPGWEAAYLDYSYLSSLLSELEKSYSRLSLQDDENNRYISIDEEIANERTSLLIKQNQDESLPTEDEFLPTDITLEDIANEAADNFLRVLRKQVEKISLFTLSRQGDLADAVGLLRFSDTIGNVNVTGDEIHLQHETMLIEHGNDSKFYGSTKSSSENDASDVFSETESFDNSDISGVLSFPLPKSKSFHRGDNSSLRLRRSLDFKPVPLFSGNAAFNYKDPFSLLKSALDDSSGQDKDASRLSILDPYTLIAVELLHVLRFVCINAMGVRKILKKYDKIIGSYVGSDAEQLLHLDNLDSFSPFMASFHTGYGAAGPDIHLQMLANSDSISAITSSLIKSATKTGVIDATVERNMIHDESLLRFKCAVDCIDIVREYANAVNEPFNAFLSRNALIVTGKDLGGISDTKKKALQILLTFDPDAILHMDKSDLSEWQQRCWNYTFTMAGNKMRSTSFDLLGGADGAVQNTLSTLSWGGADSMAMILNYSSVFLYTVNYYIAAPTANRYAIYLHTDGAFGSTLIGASSAAAFFGAFIYSWWYTHFSFKSVLLFSSLCATMGNLLYAMALSYDSMKIAVIGRLLVGLGSAEVVNRQMISSCVHFNHMTRASAQFVVYSAVGMSVGPLIAGIVDSVSGRDINIDLILPFVGGIVVNHVTVPGFLMAVAWLVQLICLVILFNEPYRINSVQSKSKRLGFFEELKLVTSLVLKNPAVPITLFLFSYIEMICEVLISSCAMICKRYFLWNGSTAGFLIASLGAFIIPAHFIVERASRRFKERAIMKYALLFITLCLIGIINYETLIEDTISLEHDAVDTAVVDSSIALNASTNALRHANKSLHNEWVLLHDPQTWSVLRNQSIEELTNILNQTDEKIKDAEQFTESELKQLRTQAYDKWHAIENITKEKWNEWSEEIATEWERLPNQTHSLYNNVDDKSREEWYLFTNQTYKDWQLILNATKEQFRGATSAGESKGVGDTDSIQIPEGDGQNGDNVSVTTEYYPTTSETQANETNNERNGAINSTQNNFSNPSNSLIHNHNDTKVLKQKRHNITKSIDTTPHDDFYHELNSSTSDQIQVNVYKNETEESLSNLRDSSITWWNDIRGGISKSANASNQVIKNTISNEYNKLNEELPEYAATIEEKANFLANSTRDFVQKTDDTVQRKWHNITKTTKQKWNDLVKSTGMAISKGQHHTQNTTVEGLREMQKLTNHSVETLNNLRDASMTWWDDVRSGLSKTANSSGEVVKATVSKKHNKVNEVIPNDSWIAKLNRHSPFNSVINVLDQVLQSAKKMFSNVTERVTKRQHIDGEYSSSGNSTEILSSLRFRSLLLHETPVSIPYDWGWGYYAYLIGMSTVFMGTIILEGVDTSIMCKAAPARLNSTFINVGLLATLIGTLGRVVGDGLITASAFVDKSRYTDFINNVYLPLIPVTLLGIYYVYKYYHTLV